MKAESSFCPAALRASSARYVRLSLGPAQPSKAAIPDRLRTIEPLAPAGAAPNRTVRFSVGMSLGRGLDFRVNGETHHEDAPVRVGEIQVWDVVNRVPHGSPVPPARATAGWS